MRTSQLAPLPVVNVAALADPPLGIMPAVPVFSPVVEQKSPIKVGSDVQIAGPGRSAVCPMTRRFNIAEKLRI